MKKITVKKKSRVGEVHRGITKYIDTEPKIQRSYVVVKENKGGVSVAKLKSIKRFDSNGSNADSALYEIKQEKYGLKKRTEVDFQRFSKNRMSNKPLQLSDKKVFPEQKMVFKLSSHDTHRVIEHTMKRKKAEAVKLRRRINSALQVGTKPTKQPFG